MAFITAREGIIGYSVVTTKQGTCMTPAEFMEARDALQGDERARESRNKRIAATVGLAAVVRSEQHIPTDQE